MQDDLRELRALVNVLARRQGSEPVPELAAQVKADEARYLPGGARRDPALDFFHDPYLGHGPKRLEGIEPYPAPLPGKPDATS